MDTRVITTIIMVVGVTIWIVWDIIVASNKRKDDTISEIIRDYTYLPVLPASLGGVCGHWTILGFRQVDSNIGFMIMIAMALLLCLWSIFVKYNRAGSMLTAFHRWIGKRPYIPFVIGYLMGGFLWGQSVSTAVI